MIAALLVIAAQKTNKDLNYAELIASGMIAGGLAGVAFGMFGTGIYRAKHPGTLVIWSGIALLAGLILKALA